jgi:hypothetical protein
MLVGAFHVQIQWLYRSTTRLVERNVKPDPAESVHPLHYGAVV